MSIPFFPLCFTILHHPIRHLITELYTASRTLPLFPLTKTPERLSYIRTQNISSFFCFMFVWLIFGPHRRCSGLTSGSPGSAQGTIFWMPSIKLRWLLVRQAPYSTVLSLWHQHLLILAVSQAYGYEFGPQCHFMWWVESQLLCCLWYLALASVFWTHQS